MGIGTYALRYTQIITKILKIHFHDCLVLFQSYTLLLDFFSDFNIHLTDLWNLITKVQEDGDMYVWEGAQFCTLSKLPNLSIQLAHRPALSTYTFNQVILTSHGPGNQTVSFRYVNLSFGTKHKEHESNLLLSPHSSPWTLVITSKDKGYQKVYSQGLFSKMRYISLRRSGFGHVYCGQWRFGKVRNQCWNFVNANMCPILREKQMTHKCCFNKVQSSRERIQYYHFFCFVKIYAHCLF